MECEGELNDFLQNQCQNWPLARENYDKLSQIRVRTFTSEDSCFYAQFNPTRIVSTAATVVDGKVERPCFLCEKNRPKEQLSLNCLNYKLLINPFPLFPQHLTIVAEDHVPQSLNGRIEDLLAMCRMMPRWVLFYNGARCGASAPDHMHFQATEQGIIPVERELLSISSKANFWIKQDDFQLSCLMNIPLTLLLQSTDVAILQRELERLIILMAEINDDMLEEPPFNLLAFFDHNHGYRIILFPRGAHRPECYYKQGEDQFLISPGAIDMAGLLIVPRETDFQRLTEKKIIEIYKQVTWSETKTQLLYQRIKNFGQRI